MPPRPLTHDLFKNFSDLFAIIITQVIIHKLVDGVFYSSIICEREGVEEIVDARTSDAIALALRFKAPIFTHKDILDSAGIFLKTGGKKEENQELEDVILDDFLQSDDPQAQSATSEDYKTNTIKELYQLLEGAVKNENYESAAKIRDEISKRD
jgi:bifunctional DNase/RNase